MLIREVILQRVKSGVLCCICISIIWPNPCSKDHKFMPTCHTYPDLIFLTPVQKRQNPWLFLCKTVQQLILETVLFIFFVVSLVIIIIKLLWHPLLSEINSCDFQLWDKFKGLVHHKNARKGDDMKDSIQDTGSSILQYELRRAMKNVFLFTCDPFFRAEGNNWKWLV